MGFPTSVIGYGPTQLVKVANLCRSVAVGNFLAGSTSIIIEDATDFTPWPVDNFVVYVEETKELLYCTGRSGNTLTVTRGFGNTTPQDIPNNAVLRVVTPAEMLQILAAEVIAIEVALGTNLGAVNTLISAAIASAVAGLTSKQAVFLGWGSVTVASATTNFGGLANITPSTTENNHRVLLPRACRIKSLRILPRSNAMVSGEFMDVEFTKNSAPMGQPLRVDGAISTTTWLSKVFTGDGLAYDALDPLSIRIVPSTLAASRAVTFNLVVEIEWL